MKITRTILKIAIEATCNLELVVEKLIYKMFHKEGKLLKNIREHNDLRWKRHCEYLQSELDKEHTKKYGWSSQTIQNQ